MCTHVGSVYTAGYQDTRTQARTLTNECFDWQADTSGVVKAGWLGSTGSCSTSSLQSWDVTANVCTTPCTGQVINASFLRCHYRDHYCGELSPWCTKTRSTRTTTKNVFRFLFFFCKIGILRRRKITCLVHLQGQLLVLMLSSSRRYNTHRTARCCFSFRRPTRLRAEQERGRAL